MRWLSIEARFLAGEYHGQGERGRVGQWPPNPHRVLQALVAAGNLGYRRLEFSDAKKAALRWLEVQGPPEIVGPRATPANRLRIYVPNNDLDKVARAWARRVPPGKGPSELRTEKDLRPHLFDRDAALRFLWPIADSNWESARPHAELLCAEARFLHSLGLGIDLVVGDGRILTEADRQGLGGEVYVADGEESGWRVALNGSFDEIMERHAASAQRRLKIAAGRGDQGWFEPPGPPTVVTEVGYKRRSAPRRRRVHVFGLVDEYGAYRSFDPRDAVIVAAWLRHGAHRRARALGLDPDFVESFVCGHGDDPESKNRRFSYVPLPTVASGGRDGRIRRVAIVEPFGASGGDPALAVVRRLSRTSLVEEGTGEIKAELRPMAAAPSDGVIRRYLTSSTRWGSVTPLVLPGHDDRRHGKAYPLVLKALAQAGYTTPAVEVHIQREPIFAGAELAIRYRVPEYLQQLPRLHAIVTFAEPVYGPVIIGAGRHIGLGVFANLG